MRTGVLSPLVSCTLGPVGTAGATGAAAEGSDLSTVPLCRACHAELRRVGPGTFQNARALNLWGVAWRLVVEYFTGEVVG